MCIQKTIAKQGLVDFVELHCDDSLSFLGKTSLTFDMGFFDSLCEIRAREFQICLERDIISQLGVFHDTSRFRCDSLQGWPEKSLHDQYRLDLHQFANSPSCCGSFESELSRGFIAIFIRRPNPAVERRSAEKHDCFESTTEVLTTTRKGITTSK